MKSSEKFKLCPSCDGKAPLEVVICPYCAQSFNDPTIKFKNSLSQSYNPPYSAERTHNAPSEPSVKTEAAKEAVTTEKSLFLPIALTTIGSNLVILSALLLILSHEGKVELSWNSSYWMLYALLGLPLVFVGYKLIKKEN
jgi:hypothetical protein